MAYLGLARKWRPQTFEDLVGQGHIARTLSAAIKLGRVSQGYLFTGTRGIGKTSAARIFAKVLRCQQQTSPGISCNKCTDCTEIAEGRSIDVLEIDGASNNGVDAIREIRENAKFLPSSGTRKIYIIDEVHMLTTAAFNALLKTLEEPPAHVFFIFATTDPQKIPATVLSRCQRFDFKRVTHKDILTRLKLICDSEKVAVDSAALDILAREAEGSMRDAVSLLDQVVSVSDSHLTAQVVTTALGLVDKQTVLDCVTGVLRREPLKALEAVGRVHSHGFDLKQFSREVLRYFRQILVARLLLDNNSQANLSQFLDLSDIDMEDVRGLVSDRSVDDLDLLFRMLNHGIEDVARSSIPKIVLDVLMIKMATSLDIVDLAGIAATDLRPAGPAPQAQPAAPVSKPQAQSPTESFANSPAMQKAATQAAQQTAPQAPHVAPAAVQAALPTSPIENTSWWKKTVAFVKSQKPMAGNILENLNFEGITDPGAGGALTLLLGYTKDHSFYKDQLQSKAYSELITQLLKNYLGRAVRLDYKEVLSNKSIEEQEVERLKTATDLKKKAVLESDALKATQQLLGARLEKIEVNGVI